MTQGICDTCRWFAEGFRDHEGVLKKMPRRNDRPARGRCHIRSSPDIFPMRWSDDHCGEHSPKGSAEARSTDQKSAEEKMDEQKQDS
ncbi:MAG: hypothetical protein U1E28_00265 [Beijerinckiaceae bacterium]